MRRASTCGSVSASRRSSRGSASISPAATRSRRRRLLVATGRRPNVEGLGLEQLGVEITPRGITVDDRLRAADDVWAIGDVNGIAQFTHVGKYQARVAAADLCRQRTRADYRAIPAGVFTDPEVATVGRTDGDGLVTARIELDSVPRLSTYEKPARPGFLRLFADPRAGRPRRRRLRRAAGGGVARPADARDPRGRPARDAPRHDPAVPDLLRRRLLRVAGARRGPLVTVLS